MIVVVEGADKVGKTTLIAQLNALTGWPVVKIRWALTGDAEVETRAMATATVEILSATRPNAIFDRSYFSWWAYGPALGYAVDYMHDLIADFVRVPEAKLVLLTASASEITRRFEREPDLYFPLETILAANARFPSLLALLPDNLPSVHIDTSSTRPAAVLEQAKTFLGLGS